MAENSQEVEPTPLEPNRADFEPQDNSEQVSSTGAADPSSVEFSVSDVNHDYAKGVFLRNARELQAIFVELYKQDPSGSFRLTLERL